MFGICDRCQTGGYLERAKSGEYVCLNCAIPGDDLVECMEYSEWWEKEYARMRLGGIDPCFAKATQGKEGHEHRTLNVQHRMLNEKR